MSTEKMPAITDIIPAPSAEQTVNTNEVGPQLNSAISGPDAQGRKLVVWQSDISASADIFGQFYDKYNNKEGSEFRVNTETFWEQEKPDVCKLDDDSWVVVWPGRNPATIDNDIFGQKLFNNGTFDGAAFQINTYMGSGGRYLPHIAALNNNEYAVCWTSYNQDGFGRYSIHAQRFDTSGPLGSEIAVEPGQTDLSSRSAITKLDQGGFYIAWIYAPTQDWEGVILGRRFDSLGNSVSGITQLSPPASTTLENTDIKQLSDGRLLVVWSDGVTNTNSLGIYGQQLDVDGIKLDDVFKISSYKPRLTTSTFRQPRITLGTNSILISYSFHPVGENAKVFLQLINSLGNKLGPEFKTNYSPEVQTSPVAIYMNDGYILTWSSDGVDDNLTSIQMVTNVPEYFVVLDDKKTNQAQNYLYTEDAPDSATVKLGRVLVNSSATEISIRYQISGMSVGLLQFSGALPSGVTVTSYDKDTGIIEISGPVLALNQMPDLEFIPFPNANANADISIEVAENGDWVNAIKLPNAKHLLGTPVNDPVQRNDVPPPNRYDVPFTLADYFEDVDGLGELTYSIFTDGNFALEVDANGHVLNDNRANLQNVLLALVNNGTAFKVIPQSKPTIYRVEAIDNVYTADVEWKVPALIGLGGPSTTQKRLRLAGDIIWRAVAAISAGLIVYAPLRWWQNRSAKKAFAHELDRKFNIAIDPVNNLQAALFLLLFAEPIIKTVFSSGSFFGIRGGVTDREIKHIAADLADVFNELYIEGYCNGKTPPLISIIDQLLEPVVAKFQQGYQANLSNEIVSTTTVTTDDNAPLTNADDLFMQKQIKILRKAIVTSLTEAGLENEVNRLRSLIASEVVTIIHQHAIHGSGAWYSPVIMWGKKLLRFLHMKGSATSDTVQSSHAEICQKVLLKLEQYHEKQNTQPDVEAPASNGQQTYSVALNSFGKVTTDGKTVDQTKNASATKDTVGHSLPGCKVIHLAENEETDHVCNYSPN